MQRVLTVLLISAGLAIGGWALLDRTGDDIGTVSVGQDAASRDDQRDRGPDTPDPTPDSTPGSASVPRPTAAPDPTPSASTAPPAIGRSSGRIEDLASAAAPQPSRIQLPSIAVDAPIVPVGVDPDGLMTVPEDVATIGWYRFGSDPTSPAGTTVLAGHVDDRVQGRGAFFGLRAMEVDDEITVTDERGDTTAWRVTGRRTFQKASLPIADLFRRDGPPRLVLITCGGDFDRAAGSYASNVVIEAVPVP